MAKPEAWTDLLDPSEEEIHRHAPATLLPAALEQLNRPATLSGDARPAFQSHDDYVLGVLLVAVAVPAEDRVFYQEVDLVLTDKAILTIRKTPPGEPPFDPGPVHAVCSSKEEISPGMIAFHLVENIAERYLDLLDTINEEIGELEDNVDSWPRGKVTSGSPSSAPTSCACAEHLRPRAMRCAAWSTAAST